MLEEVDQKISDEHEQRTFFAVKFDAAWHHLQHRRRQHKTGSNGHEVFEITAIPMPLNKDRAAKNVSGGGGQSKHETEDENVHLATMPYVQYVSILHDVVFAFKAKFADGARGGFRA